MKKQYDWLYLLAAVLAFAAVAIRVYRWQAGGEPFKPWDILVPVIFFVALMVMWLAARGRRKDGNG